MGPWPGAGANRDVLPANGLRASEDRKRLELPGPGNVGDIWGNPLFSLALPHRPSLLGQGKKKNHRVMNQPWAVLRPRFPALSKITLPTTVSLSYDCTCFRSDSRGEFTMTDSTPEHGPQNTLLRISLATTA